MGFAACIGVLGTALLTGNANALTRSECEELPGNMFLAAVERGDCDLDIQTAAGPQEELIDEGESGGNRNRDGRNGGKSGTDGGSEGGGSRSGSPAGGRGKP
jgi:hypothetical protein